MRYDAQVTGRAPVTGRVAFFRGLFEGSRGLSRDALVTKAADETGTAIFKLVTVRATRT